MTEQTPVFSPFRTPAFTIYWLVALSANFGWLIQMVGASWTMTSLHASPEMVALVQTSVALPIMLFSLPAGALADAFGRRATVVVSQALLLVISVLLAVIAWFGWLTPWSLLALTFLVGSAKALNNPAWQTMVREIVPREEIPSAIALGSMGFNLARSVGPAIGGVIVASVGAFAAFALNAVSNIGVIVVALGWKRPERNAALPPERMGAAMWAGIRYVSLSPNLLKILMRAGIFNFAAVSAMALMPLVARDLLGGGAQLYGVLLGAFGIGAVLGALGGARLRNRMSLETLVRLGFLVFAFAVALVAVQGGLVLTLVGLGLGGASWLLTLSTFNTVVQLSSPRWVLSRCHALYHTACFAGNAAGSWIWGLLAAAYGIPAALYVSGGVLVLGAALGLVQRLVEIDSARMDPDGAWTPPATSLDLLPNSGPILTSVQFRIREADVPEFLGLMAERRRGRIRDGARAWTLARDLADPELWTERYKTPTWAEHHRHHERRTVEGADVSARIRALNKADPIRVSYELVRPTGTPPPDSAEIFSDLGHH